MISPGRGAARPSAEPLNLNSTQARVGRRACPELRPSTASMGGPHLEGGPWQGGAGEPEPRTVLLHSPTPPLARLHSGDRRAWDGLAGGGGGMLPREAGDSGKIPGGPLQPGPHHRGRRDSAQALFSPFSLDVLQTKAGQKKDKASGAPGSCQERPSHGQGPMTPRQAGNGGQQKAFTGKKKKSTSIYKPGDLKQGSDFPRSQDILKIWPCQVHMVTGQQLARAESWPPFVATDRHLKPTCLLQ